MTRQEILRYILTDAIEGGYIDGWADLRNIKRNDEHDVISFDVKDFDDKNAKWITINEENIDVAIEKIRNGEVKIANMYADQFAGEVDDWFYDAIGADCAVQIAAFGEIIFG